MVKTREEAQLQIEQWQSEGLKVGFTSGVFDLLHAGHVDYLGKAKMLCDKLVVAVNSDASVRKYKGPKRPIQPTEDRLRVLESLRAVDYCFSFDERSNNTNVEVLKPNIYIKAGDYKIEQLSSAPIVQAYGGTVELVPDLKGQSSSSLIERILERFADEVPRFDPEEVSFSSERAVFLDRDGTLIEHVEYIHEVEKVRLLPGVPEGLKKLKDAGFSLFVTTNQSGIGLGYFTVEQFFQVNREMLKQLWKEGASVDRVYFSQASGAHDSPMRKPNTGMIDRAVREFGVSPEKSFVIGDTSLDMKLARNAGSSAVFVSTGATTKADMESLGVDCSADSFLEAVEWILST